MARKRVLRNRLVDESSEGSGGQSQDDTDGNETEHENRDGTEPDQQEQSTNVTEASVGRPIVPNEDVHESSDNAADVGASTSAAREQQQTDENSQVIDGTPPLPKRRRKDPSLELNQNDDNSDMNETNDGEMSTELDEAAEGMNADGRNPHADLQLLLAELNIPPSPVQRKSYHVGDMERLMISHIVCENFKSYHGEHQLGPFHQSFSSIVGPNGSGKSNVIDAILFVFGFHNKKLRTKKISSLIHQSDQHKNLDFCSVEIHFQLIRDRQDDTFDVVPDSQFAVKRSVKKDDSSSYYIVRRGKSRKSNRSDVNDLLRQHGIDLDHNRFLILQGEVEQIALMKPKGQNENDEGMLEYLEDIIGSSKYKSAIEKLASDVEKLSEDRQSKLSRVKDVEKDKDELEAIKNEAVEFLKAENKKLELTHQLHQIAKAEAEERFGIETERYEKCKADADAAQKEIDKITEMKVGKVAEKKQLQREIDGLDKEFGECNKTIEKLTEEDVRVREDMKNVKKRLKKLEKDVDDQVETVKNLEKQPEKLKNEAAELDEKRKRLEEQILEFEPQEQAGLSKVEQETKDLRAQKEQEETKLIDLNGRVNDCKHKVDIKKNELEMIKSEKTRVEQKLKDSEAQLHLLEDKLDGLNKTETDLQKSLPDVKKELENANSQLQALGPKETEAESKYRKMRQKTEDAKASAHDRQSRDAVLNYVMRLKQEKKVKGVYGRLGDLGAIDEKYDVAISTACGALDNIVVESIDEAQKIVDYLKQDNVGVATFLALDKVGERLQGDVDKQCQTPEDAPRLFDLVRVENDRVRVAFLHALGNTIVASDMTQARRLAYGRDRAWRVVTLRGELIELSGVISGGGNRPLKGKMGSSVAAKDEITAEQLQRMEQDAKKLEEDCIILRNQRRNLESRIDEYSRKIPDLEREHKKAVENMKITENGIQTYKKSIEQVKARLNEVQIDENKVLQLEAEVAALQDELDAAKDQADKVAAVVQRLQKQIADVHHKHVGSITDKLEKIKADLEHSKQARAKTEAAAKSAHRNKEKAEVKLKSLEEDKASLVQKYEELKEALEQLVKKAEDACDKKQEIDTAKTELEKKMKGLLDGVKELERQEQEIKSSTIEQKAQLENAEKETKKAKSAIKHYEAEMEKIQLNDLSDLITKKRQKSNEMMEEEAESADEGGESADERPADTDAVTELPIYTKEHLLREMRPKKERIGLKKQNLENELEQWRPKINMSAIEEYRRKEAEYRRRCKELDDITKTLEHARDNLKAAKKLRLDKFLMGFKTISAKLKEMYQMITLGGDAELEIVDACDPFSEGVVFSVRPPKKSWKQICNLSGGEKTLSSLALVFALHHYKPTPFYVMDEIDAALDFKNVSIVANYIKERTKDAQFIIISLRNDMFELADLLVGIYKTYNCTKSVVLKVSEIESSMPVALRQKQGLVTSPVRIRRESSNANQSMIQSA